MDNKAIPTNLKASGHTQPVASQYTVASTARFSATDDLLHTPLSSTGTAAGLTTVVIGPLQFWRTIKGQVVTHHNRFICSVGAVEHGSLKPRETSIMAGACHEYVMCHNFKRPDTLVGLGYTHTAVPSHLQKLHSIASCCAVSSERPHRYLRSSSFLSPSYADSTRNQKYFVLEAVHPRPNQFFWS